MVLHHLVAELGEIEFGLAFCERHGRKASQPASGRIDRRQSEMRRFACCIAPKCAKRRLPEISFSPARPERN
jgi:hypothetical protein